jgi:hypothetical protein
MILTDARIRLLVLFVALFLLVVAAVVFTSVFLLHGASIQHVVGSTPDVVNHWH